MDMEIREKSRRRWANGEAENFYGLRGSKTGWRARTRLLLYRLLYEPQPPGDGIDV